MKIVYLCPSLEKTDGWSRYSHDIITRVAIHEDVTVLCQNICDGVDPSIRQIPVFRSSIRYLTNPLFVLLDAHKVRKIVANEISGCDECIIHCTTEAHAMFIPFLRRLGIKTVMTTHGTYSVLPLLSWKMRCLYKRVYKSVGRIVSVSSYTKRHLLKHAGFLSDAKIQVMTNGVDYEEKPARTSHSDGIFRILSVGEVKNRKGAHHLVRVARLLKEKNQFPFRVTFVGRVQKDQPYYLDLQEYIQQHSLEDCVQFSGMVSQEDLDRHYRDADLFALLSVHENGHYEGYPLVFHEAAMWGLPTVGTFDCGAEDAIQDGKTGVLVHPDSHADIAEAITKIQSGDTPIRSDVCKAWAQANDWSKKNLLTMYD
jgi:glycosyltransferase involved in cell wall biosynthesis